jgi:hypothetical protein
MKIEVDNVGDLVLTPEGIHPEPLAVPNDHHRQRRLFILNRILRHSRGRFERDHPGGTDADFLRWLDGDGMNGFGLRLVE